MTRDDEIQDVMAEEKARGKKHLETDARKARQKMLRDVGFLLRSGNRKEFLQNLLRLGLKPGTPEYDLALQAWDEKHGA